MYSLTPVKYLPNGRISFFAPIIRAELWIKLISPFLDLLSLQSKRNRIGMDVRNFSQMLIYSLLHSWSEMRHHWCSVLKSNILVVFVTRPVGRFVHYSDEWLSPKAFLRWYAHSFRTRGYSHSYSLTPSNKKMIHWWYTGWRVNRLSKKNLVGCYYYQEHCKVRTWTKKKTSVGLIVCMCFILLLFTI